MRLKGKRFEVQKQFGPGLTRWEGIALIKEDLKSIPNLVLQRKAKKKGKTLFLAYFFYETFDMYKIKK